MSILERENETAPAPKTWRYLLTVLAAIIGLLGFSADKDMVGFFRAFHAYDISYVLYFVLFLLLFYHAFRVRNKRIIVCAAIGAAIVSAIELVGFYITRFDSLSGLLMANNPAGDGLVFSAGQAAKSVLIFVGAGLLFYGAIVLVYSFLFDRSMPYTGREYGLFARRKSSFFLLWAIIFAAWLPYYLALFPGAVILDVVDQLKCIFYDVWYTQHPPFHTALIWFCTQLAQGNLFNAIAIYSALQMLIMSAVFAFAVYYMSAKKYHLFFRVAALVYFAAFPLNGFYSVYLTKDILFAGALLILTIVLIELITKREEFFKSKLHIIALVLALLGVGVTRNNGLYISILSIVVLLLFLKGARKPLLAVGGACVIILAFYYGPFMQISNVRDNTSSRETLSIPLQQLARTIKYRSGEMTQEETSFIGNLLPSDEPLGELYDPRSSDPVKSNFDNDYFEQNKGKFFTTWLNMAAKYPKEFTESFLANTAGLWYPEAEIAYIDSTEIAWYDGVLEVEQESLLPPFKEAIENFSLISMRSIPVVSMLYSMGFVFICAILLILFLCAKRQFAAILAFVPLIFLILTNFAAPVALVRYMYGVFIALPILIPFAVHLGNNKAKDKTIQRGERG